MKKYHHCVKFTYPLSFQTRIPKVDQHTGGKWLIHGTKHRKDNQLQSLELSYRISFWVSQRHKLSLYKKCCLKQWPISTFACKKTPRTCCFIHVSLLELWQNKNLFSDRPIRISQCTACPFTHWGRHFPDDIFKSIFSNQNIWITIKISLKFVTKVLINNIPSLVQIMDRRRPGDKPLSQPMMVNLRTHICVTRPQWVNLRAAIQRFVVPS